MLPAEKDPQSSTEYLGYPSVQESLSIGGDVLKAWTNVNSIRIEIVNIATSVELRRSEGKLLISQLHDLGYNGSKIWLYSQTISYKFECLNFLEAFVLNYLPQYPHVYEKGNTFKPLVYLDKEDVRILRPFFEIALLAANNGVIYYINKDNIENLKRNIAHVIDGALLCIRNDFQIMYAKPKLKLEA
ncbi:MAG: hypothetical protein ABIM99_03075 [Candidatus Dojkabacteria bacterium]